MTYRMLLAITVGLTLPMSTFGQTETSPSHSFKADFSAGLKAWEIMDDAWKIKTLDDGSQALSLHQKKSNYQPPHRSPLHMALVKDQKFGSFEMNVKVKSTHEDYNHRDVCFFFGFQGADRFYYVHLGKKMDPHANQIFIVNKSDRTKISTTTSDGTDWDDQWHHVRIRRSVEDGSIQVFFDDMQKPVMTATDKTFGTGKIGVGSFDDIADFQSIEIQPLEKKEKQNRGQ